MVLRPSWICVGGGRGMCGRARELPLPAVRQLHCVRHWRGRSKMIENKVYTPQEMMYHSIYTDDYCFMTEPCDVEGTLC